jgi:hypothetical protein
MTKKDTLFLQKMDLILLFLIKKSLKRPLFFNV